MPLQELLAGTTEPPAAGPRILYRRYTRSGIEAARFKQIPPTHYQGRTVVFISIEHTAEPAKRLPAVGIVERYVDEQESRLLAEERVRCGKSIPSRSSATAPADRLPPTLAGPASPAPGPTTRSSRGRSSARSAATTTEAQYKLDL